LNKDDKPVLNRSQLKDYRFQGKFDAWYFYSNEHAVLNMQMSDYRDRHDLHEYFIFIDRDELKPQTFLGPFFGYTIGLGFWYDFDVVMVNQIMHMFRR
jgi:hypothetical protein